MHINLAFIKNKLNALILNISIIYLLMSELFIYNQNTNNLDNCDYLSITKLTIKEVNNINLLLDKLYKFTNLQQLVLSNNQIKGIIEIKGLDKLVNLQTLRLYNNQITEIKGLDNLVNLQELNLSYNQITEIKRT